MHGVIIPTLFLVFDGVESHSMEFWDANRPRIVGQFYTRTATVYIYKDVREVYLNFVFVQFSDTWKIYYSLTKSQG